MTAQATIIAEIPDVTGGTCNVSVDGAGRVRVTFDNPLLDEVTAEPIEFTGDEALQVAREVLAGKTASSIRRSLQLAAAVLVLLAARA